MSEEFDTIEEAQECAFSHAYPKGLFAFCEVDVIECGQYGWDTVEEYVNHHDFRKNWSGWVAREQYEAEYR